MTIYLNYENVTYNDGQHVLIGVDNRGIRFYIPKLKAWSYEYDLEYVEECVEVTSVHRESKKEKLTDDV